VQHDPLGEKLIGLVLALSLMTSLSSPTLVHSEGRPSSPIPPSDPPPAVDPPKPKPRAATPPTPPGDPPVSVDPVRLCELAPQITTVETQENSSWCWAASTHLVIKHLEPLRDLTQCQVVNNTLAPGSTDIDCCLVTDEAMKTANTSDPKVRNSVAVCWTTNRPESALDANGYYAHYAMIEWDSSNTPPEGPGLTWDEVKGQICSNRPFISVKLWDEGGTHDEVITGYHFNGSEPWVDINDPGIDTFAPEPYEDYKRKPNEWVHVRDYIDIGK